MCEKYNGVNFDAEAEYTEQVVPLFEQLAEKCAELGLPFILAIKYSKSDEDIGMGIAVGMNERSDLGMRAAVKVLEREAPKFVVGMLAIAGEVHDETQPETTTVQ